MELQCNVGYKHSWTAMGTIWLRTEEDEKYAIETARRISLKYKRMLRENLGTSKDIIIFDVPDSLSGKKFTIVINIAALMNEEVNKSKLVDYSDIIIPILESYCQELNAAMLVPVYGTAHKRNKD